MKRVLIVLVVAAVTLSQALAQEEKPERKEGRRQGAPNPEEQFKRMDKNADSVISKDEYRGSAERFAAADADGSGGISTQEWKAAYEKRMKEWGDPAERFKKSDANGDGVLDKTEFKGPAEMFDRIDADKDGKLTQEEMKASRERARGRRREGEKKTE